MALTKGKSGGKRAKANNQRPTYNGVPVANDFAEIIRSSPSKISDEKVYTFSVVNGLGQKRIPFIVKKGELTDALDFYQVNDFVIDIYNDRSGQNTLNRLSKGGWKATLVYPPSDPSQKTSKTYYKFERV